MESRQLRPEIEESAPRRWRRWRVAMLPIGLTLFAIGAALWVAVRGGGGVSCERAAHAEDYHRAIVSCRGEYERSGDPRTGARLAESLYRTADHREAATVAHSLLITPVRADALRILGKIATDEERYDKADELLRLSAEYHTRAEQWGEVAKVWLAIGNVARDRGDFVGALEALDRCVAEAKRAKAQGRVTIGFCQLARAQVLAALGHSTGAEQAIKDAQQTFVDQRFLRWVQLTEGDRLQRLGDHEQAVVAFGDALATSKVSIDSAYAQLNLAYSLAETRRFGEAERRLEEVRSVDPDDTLIAARHKVEAHLAWRRGEHDRAARLAEQARAALVEPSPDELRELDMLRAEAAFARGELETAARHARSAVEHMQRLRAKQPAIQVRAWLGADRRAPFELLFASLARRGDAEAALVAFEHWQGRAVLDGLATESAAGGGASDLARVVAQTQELTKLLPPLERSPLVAAPRPDHEILAAVRGAPVLALVVARGELWRIASLRGRLVVQPLGSFRELKRQLAELHAAPREAGLAGALGALLVPPELAVRDARALHVVLDEPLAGLPLAALQVNGRTLSSQRPIARPARPSDVTCVARRPGPRRIVVLADAHGDLPHARREASELQRRGVAAQAFVGALATRQVLFALDRSALTHISSHTGAGDLGGFIKLADGDLSALEVAGRGKVPHQVVLAGCNSAFTTAPGTYSMAMAYLAAGADQVVATLRAVSDAGAAKLTQELYRQDTTDLVQALARAQAARARDEEDEDWARFAVFGREVCNSHTDEKGE